MMLVVVPAIVIMVSTVIATMIRVTATAPISPISSASPISRENTPGGGEQGNDEYCIKNGFHMPNLSTY
jgi:hypothetical protein